MNNPTPEHQEFERIVARTDELLWKTYDASVSKTPCADVRLRFPVYRSDDLKPELRHRVSEQEARFTMTGELAKSSLLYAVEAPTFETYSFTGNKAMSGQTDVAVYLPDTKRMWNVEFKAHGFSSVRSSKSSIQKDIEKLLRESVDGFWFHTLEGVDNSTLTTVWNAFSADLREVADAIKRANSPIPNKTLVFHICVLRQGFSIELRIPVDAAQMGADWLKDILAPTYSVTQDSLISIADAKGWTVRQKV